MNYFWQMYSNKEKIRFLGLIIGIIAVIFYTDTLARLRYERPIYLGKIYAISVMLGDKENMIDWAGTKKLKEKIKSLDIKPIEPEWIRGNISQWAWDYNLQLYKADRLSERGSLILTYAFIDGRITEEVYTYTIELAPLGKPTLWDRSIGKLFMSEYKQPTPKWIVVDYYTDSDIRDYAKNWDSKIADYWAEKTDTEIIEEVEERLKNHIEHIDEMQKRAEYYMRIQNEEVKKYLRGYVKECKQKGLIF